MTTINDATIASAMRRNAEDGFRMLMKKYKVPVYWHTRRLLVSHDDAQDATQETLIRVFRSFDRFKGDCPLGAWIYRIATNEALRILEQRSRDGTPMACDHRHKKAVCHRRWHTTPPRQHLMTRPLRRMLRRMYCKSNPSPHLSILCFFILYLFLKKLFR